VAMERGGNRRRRPRDEQEERSDGLEEVVIRIYRCSKVVKGGRRFSLAALVAVGDRAGRVGIGYGKGNETPVAVAKAMAEARKNLKTISLDGNTIPHPVTGRCGASKVVLFPASEGTGVIAGKKLRPLLELAGIHNLLTKAYGSTSPKNLIKAGMDALLKLRSAELISELRGVDVK
jgi:small subunit ribosomal protein S5